MPVRRLRHGCGTPAIAALRRSCSATRTDDLSPAVAGRPEFASIRSGPWVCSCRRCDIVLKDHAPGILGLAIGFSRIRAASGLWRGFCGDQGLRWGASAERSPRNQHSARRGRHRLTSPHQHRTQTREVGGSSAELNHSGTPAAAGPVRVTPRETPIRDPWSAKSIRRTIGSRGSERRSPGPP